MPIIIHRHCSLTHKYRYNVIISEIGWYNNGDAGTQLQLG